MAKPNYAGGASGAIQGAQVGFQAGGPVGGVIGAVTGGTLGLFGGKKKKKKAKPVSTLDPHQQQLYQEKYAGLRGQGPLADLYSFDSDAANNNFQGMVAKPAYRDFQENIIPGITGQFRGSNIQNSSYTGEALGRAGRNVQESLDAQRANYIYNGQQAVYNRKANAVNDQLNMQTFALERPDSNGGSGGIDSILSQLGPQAMDFIKDYMNKGGGGGASRGPAPTVAPKTPLPNFMG